MNLLIVDDHEGIRAMIRQLSSLPAAAVRECDCGEKAIELARDFAPDLITMDLRLPGMNGLEAVRAIRAICPAIPIVIVSAYDQGTVRLAARQAGATDFIAKDNLNQLRAVFARFGAGAPSATTAAKPVDCQHKE